MICVRLAIEYRRGVAIEYGRLWVSRRLTIYRRHLSIITYPYSYRIYYLCMNDYLFYDELLCPSNNNTNEPKHSSNRCVIKYFVLSRPFKIWTTENPFFFPVQATHSVFRAHYVTSTTETTVMISCLCVNLVIIVCET